MLILSVSAMPVGSPFASSVTSSTETHGERLCVTYRRVLSPRIVTARGSLRSAMPSRSLSTSAMVLGNGMWLRSHRYSCSVARLRLDVRNSLTVPERRAVTAK